MYGNIFVFKFNTHTNISQPDSYMKQLITIAVAVGRNDTSTRWKLKYAF